MTIFLLLSSLLILASLGVLILKSKGLPKLQTITFAIAAPILVALIYIKIGTPNALNFVAEEVQATQANNQDLLSKNNIGPEDIQRAITSLQDKIDANPNDIESLNLLANTYLISEQIQLAVLTLEKLIALGQSDPDTLVKTADSYTFIEQGNVNLRAEQLLDAAIQQNPNHPQALWLSGMAAVQSGKIGLAKTYWNRLIPLIPDTSQEQQLKALLAELDQRQIAAGTGTTVNKEINSSDAQKQNTAMITVNVSLSDSLLQENSTIEKNHTVFVFARAKSGPKAPLAVKRLTVADLPTTIQLTEKDAMLPQATISQFQEIIISAKISKSGNPSIKEGDVESKSIEINMLQKEDSYTLKIE